MAIAPGRVRCGLQAHPHPGGLRDQLNLEPNNPTLNRRSDPGGAGGAHEFTEVRVHVEYETDHAMIDITFGTELSRFIGT